MLKPCLITILIIGAVAACDHPAQEPATQPDNPILGEAKITRNYTAELNAEISKIPEQDRAAPLYLEAWSTLQENIDSLYSIWQVRPGDPAWPEAVKYLQANAEALRLTRLAAQRPHLGRLLVAPSYAEVQEDYFVDNRVQWPEGNPPLMRVRLPHTGQMRALARLLRVDTHLAAIERDRSRVVQNIVTLVSMASHLGGKDSWSGDFLIGIPMQAGAIGATGEIISEHVEILSDRDVAALEAAFAHFDGQAAFLRAVGDERLSFADMAQRIYTLDSDGDGVLIPNANGVFGADAFRPHQEDDATEAIRVAPAARRKESIAEYERIMALYEQSIRADPWTPGAWASRRELRRLRSDESWRWRFVVAEWMVPSRVNRVIEIMHQVNAETSAARIIIAAELHRRATGHWPATLDDLDPTFLETLTRDPFTGDHLIYRLQDGEPLIYSPGPDRDDDDAVPIEDDPYRAFRWLDPSRPDPPDGDWILYPPQ